MASPSVANRCPKKEAKEGIEASPLAHTARFCKCSCFNIALTLEDPPFVCFLPLASSLSEIGFWNLDGVFAALFMPPPLFPMLSLLSLLSFSEEFRRTVNTGDARKVLQRLYFYFFSFGTLGLFWGLGRCRLNVDKL